MGRSCDALNPVCRTRRRWNDLLRYKALGVHSPAALVKRAKHSCPKALR